ncbi:MAG: transmembrane regulator PrtR, partial [Acidobacteria bacterium]|nr:transmembrane regulator PrtR [Acidobacteriota bacterium]
MGSMNCADVDAIMTAYVDAEAAPADAEAVRAHLEGCPDCRARAAAEQDMRARLQVAAPTLGERAPA